MGGVIHPIVTGGVSAPPALRKNNMRNWAEEVNLKPELEDVEDITLSIKGTIEKLQAVKSCDFSDDITAMKRYLDLLEKGVLFESEVACLFNAALDEVYDKADENDILIR